jgi:hypothetical protein
MDVISVAPVAQWLEHWSYEPRVGGSNPPWSSRSFFILIFFLMKITPFFSKRKEQNLT